MPILLRRKQRLRVHPLPANIQLLCLIPTALLHPAAATFEQGNPKTLVLTMTGVTHTQEARPWPALSFLAFINSTLANGCAWMQSFLKQAGKMSCKVMLVLVFWL